MIIKLTGNVSHRGSDYLIFEVGSVGYRLMAPEFAVPRFQGVTTVFCHEIAREDVHELFGFLELSALELFWKLIAISGVGPRSAQKIVFSGSGDEVQGRIMQGDLAFLQSVPGIGKKTAQKIVLELKGVLMESKMGNGKGEKGGEDEEAIEALVGIGYKRREAEQAIEGLSGDTEEKLKKALKALARV